MSEPTWFVEWTDNDPDPEGDTTHSIAEATVADVLSIVAGALEGNTWDVQIMQYTAEETAA